jgi:hypothetical protein
LRPGRGKVAAECLPEAGTALLHRHGERCMLHAGAPVLSGAKYLLRTDVAYR